MPNLDFFDILVIASCIEFTYLAVMHDIAARELYVLGGNYGVPGYDDWKANTYKHLLIKGVFFIIPFVWIQNCLITTLLVLSGDRNPLGGWLGVINVVFSIPQAISAHHNAGANKIGRFVVRSYIFHIVVCTMWAWHKLGG